MITWLTPRDVSASVLLTHLPRGIAWIAWRTVGTIAYRLVYALGRTHQDAWQFMDTIQREIDYRSSVAFLEEWETACGLPDRCIPRAKTLAERRKWIAFRLDKKRWNTIQDWYDLAELVGVTVKITPGWLVQRPALYGGGMYYPKRYDLFPKLGRFRIYIDQLDADFRGYPYDNPLSDSKYPIPYGSDAERWSTYRCLISKLCPANVLVIWNEFPPTDSGNGFTFDTEFEEDFS